MRYHEKEYLARQTKTDLIFHHNDVVTMMSKRIRQIKAMQEEIIRLDDYRETVSQIIKNKK